MNDYQNNLALDEIHFHCDQDIISFFMDFEYFECLTILLGLTTYEEFQSYIFGINEYLFYILNFSIGNKKINQKQLIPLLNVLNDPFTSFFQDPPENVFVTNISSEFGGTYKIFQAHYNDNAFYLERFINIIDNTNSNKFNDNLKRNIHCLLKISTYIINKLNLETNTSNYKYFKNFSECEILHNFKKIKLRTKITTNELEELKINIKCLEPFIFQKELLLKKEIINDSYILNHPIFIDDNFNYYINVNAISLAVRNYIILNYSNNRNMLMKKYIESVKKLLTQFKTLGNFPILTPLPNKIEKVDNFYIKYFTISASCDYPILLALLFEDFKGDLTNWREDKKIIEINKQSALNSHINQKLRYLFSNKDYVKGISLLVHCGWGRPITFFDHNDNSSIKNWENIILNLNEFCILYDFPFFNTIDFFRIKEFKNKLTRNRGDLQNLSGFINLYGYLIDNNGYLGSNKNFIFDPNKQNCVINLPTNNLVTIIKISKKDKSRRMILNLNGKYFHAKNYRGLNTISEKYINHLYSIVPKYSNNMISTVFTKNNFCIWCKTKRNKNIKLTIAISESATLWLPNIYLALEKYHIVLPQIIEWYISIKHIKNELPINKQFITIKKEKNIFNTNIKISSNSAFYKENNSGEFNMVKSFLTEILNEYNSSITPIQLLPTIFTNPNIKHIHFTFEHSYLNQFVDQLPTPYLIDKIDIGIEKIELGFVNKKIKNNEKIIKGITNCTNYLNSITEKIWGEIKNIINTYDKELILNKILLNRESIHQKKFNWEKETKSLVSEYNEDAIKFISKELNNYMMTEICSRILIEMVNCSTCFNNKRIDVLSFNSILTKAFFIFRIGFWSDGIRTGLLPPEIRIDYFGNIEINDNYLINTWNPYIQEYNNKERIFDVDNYSKYYKKPILNNNNNNKDFNFEKYWKAEYILDIEDIANFIYEIEILGKKYNKVIYKIKQKTLIDILKNGLKNKCEEDIIEFIDKITLPYRKNWDSIPTEYKNKYKNSDWYPWNYRRRLSVINRPIIKLNDENNSLLVCPSSILECMNYLFTNIMDANFDIDFFESNEMKKWIGSRNKKLGNEFNYIVANKMKDLGWEVQPEVTIRKFIDSRENNYFGDIDVLAWSKEFNIVIAIECKNLLFAKTMKEVGNQINDFQGKTKNICGKNKRDRLKKHFDRLDILSQNLNKISKFTGIKNLDCLYGLVVFSKKTLIEESNKIPKNIILFSSIEELTTPDKLKTKLIKWQPKIN